MSLKNILPFLVCLFIFTTDGFGQVIVPDSIPNIDYSEQKEYEIGGTTLSALFMLSMRTSATLEVATIYGCSSLSNQNDW